MGPTARLGPLDRRKISCPSRGIEPRFFGRPVHSLATIPTTNCMEESFSFEVNSRSAAAKFSQIITEHVSLLR